MNKSAIVLGYVSNRYNNKLILNALFIVARGKLNHFQSLFLIPTNINRGILKRDIESKSIFHFITILKFE
jgi:hypothetical protein